MAKECDMAVGRRTLAALTVAATTSVVLAGCGSSSSGGTSAPAPSNSSAATPDLSGKSYTVLGQWTGGEQAAFLSVIDAFDKATGAKGHYSAVSGGDEATVLGAKVNGGTPPDIAILALPGAIAQYGKAGKAEPVSAEGQSTTSANFSAEWAKLATVDGTLYGVPVDAANKSTVWYNTNLFDDAGISSPPGTWEELASDAKTLGDSGVSVPISVGGGDGWTLTDWFENVYLRTAGVDMYDKLTHHEIKWTDPSVATALKALKQIWGDESLIGKASKALSTPFTDSVDNVFKKNPSSAMVYEASFVATTITSDKNPAKVGVDAKFFPFPSINGSQPVLEASGDWAVAFTKNKAAQAFQAYLGTPEAAKLLVSAPGSGFLSANKNLASSAYPDATSSQLAQQIVSVGDNFRFDMSDQAPAEFGGTPNKGEWADLQSFLGNGHVAGTQQKLEKDAAAAKGW
jgi:ABC-type glycerol-3-phosphate transport system substrate-binding protein